MQTFKEPTFIRLPKNKLKVNTDFYQKMYVPANVKKLANAWDDEAVGTLTVIHDKNDDYWVVDGQHRLLAAMKLPHIKTLPCMVHDSNDVNADARLYRKINTTHKKPNARHLFKVAYELRDEPEYTIGNILEENGFSWRSHSNTCKNAPTVNCINSLTRAHKDNGVDIFSEAVRLLGTIHRNDTGKNYLNGDALLGMCFLLKYYTIPDKQKFEDAIAQCTPDLINASISDAGRNDPFNHNGITRSLSARGISNAVNSRINGRSRSKYVIYYTGIEK